MIKNMSIYQKDWLMVEKNFHCLVDELFCGHKWPKGKYIAYTTIWGMFPKFLEDKTFQIPFKHKNKRYVIVVIAHELLHFIFYDYFYKKYPKYRLDKYNFLHTNSKFSEVVEDF